MKMELILAAMLFALGAGGATTNQIELTWPLDAQDVKYNTNFTYFIYSQTNAPPVASAWQPLTNITFAAFTNANRSVSVGVADSFARFYTVTRSNRFGESPFTFPVESQLPSAGTGVEIRARP